MGDDFQAGPYTAIFIAEQTDNSSRACVDVMIEEDYTYESDHRFFVAITITSLPEVTVEPVGGQAVVTIKDNDGKSKLLYLSA